MAACTSYSASSLPKKMWCLVYFLNNIYPVIIRPTGRSYQISYDGFVSHAVSFDYNKHILESTRDVRPVVVNRSESKMTFKSMYVCPHPQSKFLRWPECIFPNHRSPNWKKRSRTDTKVWTDMQTKFSIKRNIHISTIYHLFKPTDQPTISLQFQ